MNQQAAQNATQYLIDTAQELGEAKASALLATNMLRHVKALAMKASEEKSAAAQEREAYASKTYLDALHAEFEAHKKSEILKAKCESAKATIETWRSANANQRSAERGYGSHK